MICPICDSLVHEGDRLTISAVNNNKTYTVTHEVKVENRPYGFVPVCSENGYTTLSFGHLAFDSPVSTTGK